MTHASGRIVATDLTKTFGHIQAEDHLSFTVQPGVVTGLPRPQRRRLQPCPRRCRHRGHSPAGPHMSSGYRQQLATLIVWPARRWLAAASGAAVFAIAAGAPTDVIPNPLFVRMTPVTGVIRSNSGLGMTSVGAPAAMANTAAPLAAASQRRAGQTMRVASC